MPGVRKNKNSIRYKKEEVIDVESDSHQEKKKEKKKEKALKKQLLDRQSGLKKVKLIQPDVYIPKAESRLLLIYKLIKDADTEDVLSAGVLSVNIYPIFAKASDAIDVYKQWYPENTIFKQVNGLWKSEQRLTKVQYLSDFLNKIRTNCYWDQQTINKDIIKIFRNAHQRCDDQQSYNHLSQLWITVQNKISNFLESYDKIKQEDLQEMIKNKQDVKVIVNKWPIVPNLQEMRSYQLIEDYEPNPNSEPYITQINKKLATNKKYDYLNIRPEPCPINCACFDLSQMGSFSYEKTTWNSTCENRVRRVECQNHQGTDKKCYNQQIQNQQYIHLNKDVEETYCWGIDYHTRQNILDTMPTDIPQKDKSEFISQKLMVAINQLKQNGWNMDLACDYIISLYQQDASITKLDKQMAKQLKKVLRYDQPREGFRVHTKGLGLVCINKQGIKTNSLIIPYLGEIYQPWRWYEKQDFIKKQMRDNNQKDILPDFYNIMLDIHKDDPKGIDYLFVDPIIKGNYSSRLSHSCNPNCGTVTTVSNGRYVIGMYAMRDIQPGEELTFDYCSTTESKAEYQQAICLCGQEKCKIRYLQLSNSKEYNQIIDREHCFLTRNAILLKACNDAKHLDDELLTQYNIKSSILNDCPTWLVNWTIYILQFIENEKQLYKQELDTKYAQEAETNKWNALVVQQNADERLQNLVFTLDKIKYFLKQSKSDNQPLYQLKDSELMQELWKEFSDKKNEQSLLNEMFNFFSSKNLKRYVDIISSTHRYINQNKSMLSYREQLIVTRVMFLGLSHLLIQNQHQFHYEALSLILYFMSFTYTYFRPFEFEGFSSVQFDDIEWRKVGSFRKKVKNETRSYSSQFVWGQLVGWFKQTVVSPQASLSQDRRGTLSYPSLTSFEKFERTYPFQPTKNQSSRQFFLEHILEKPSYMWPPELASWSYRNTYKLYGTVQFEQFFSEELGQDFLEQVITKYSDPLENKIDLMIQYENIKNPNCTDIIRKYFEFIKPHLGDNALQITEVIRAPTRYKRTTYVDTSKREQLYERLKNEGKSEQADFLFRFRSIFSIII